MGILQVTDYDRDSPYCPLCGAHDFESAEGQASDDKIVKLEAEIIALYQCLRKLTGEISD